MAYLNSLTAFCVQQGNRNASLDEVEFCLREKERIAENSTMPEDIKAEKLEAIDEFIKSRIIHWQ
jgi:hypothetical protein